MPKKSCRTELSRKIAINMAEYKAGRYKSPAQAIAIAYSQVQKKRPGCKKSLKKSPLKSQRRQIRQKSQRRQKSQKNRPDVVNESYKRFY